MSVRPAGVWIGAVIDDSQARLNVTIFPLEWTLILNEERDISSAVRNQPLKSVEYRIKDHVEWDFLIETDNGTIVRGRSGRAQSSSPLG